ncbi:MAG: GAF domain-containing sensor histidine kinase [Actinomycetota bacterium]|nr:GAF domain-containing sensor histidine kinase [Actinomycetota bacterium]
MTDLAPRALARERDRLRALVDAGISLSSELSLDALLQRLVETAAALTGARYAALGVIDRTGRELERFVTTGLDPETYAAIGELPRGRGILGVLIREAETLRLHDIAEDRRSVGFPANHPPMRTFLGVPVLLRGVAYGNLYLTEKEGGRDFTGEDEEVTVLLATQAAVAIENARLYESSTAWSRQLESLNEIATAMASEIELPRLLGLVARRLREIVEARLVTIALPASDIEVRIEAADGERADAIVGTSLPLAGSKHGRVLERRRSERVDSLLDDPEVDQAVARRLAARAGLFVPLVVGERAIGVVAAHDKLGFDARFTDADLRIAELFAARAAVAVDLSQRVARDALRRAVEAQEVERRRLARELHDQTGQDLTSVLLGLRAAEDAEDAAERERALASVRTQVVETLHHVRRLAVELRPKALDDFGLVPAVERLATTVADQTGMRVDVEAGLEKRLPAEVETALYRIVQEALTNVVKHAQARAVSVVLARTRAGVTAVVEDDGRGFDPDARVDGLGLLGMRERLALVDGRLKIESSPGSGTTLVAEVPLQ